MTDTPERLARRVRLRINALKTEIKNVRGWLDQMEEETNAISEIIVGVLSKPKPKTKKLPETLGGSGGGEKKTTFPLMEQSRSSMGRFRSGLGGCTSPVLAGAG